MQQALDALHTAWFIGNAPDFLIRRWLVFADYNLANERRPMVDDLLSASTVQRLVQEQRRGRQDWSFQVWQLLTLEWWCRIVLD